MQQKQPENIWAVVEVKSGIPVMVEIYRDMRSAEAREKRIRKKMHPENDETGVFRVLIPPLLA